MSVLSVVVVATDSEQRTVLQVLVDGTNVARTVHVCTGYPAAPTDPMMKRIEGAAPEVLLVDIPTENPTQAMRTIELLRREMPDVAVFAIGNLSQPQTIVGAMRAGAREFVERPTNTTDLLDAFVRLGSTQRKVQKEGSRGKIFTVINAKGGSGATTVAVNLALALQAANGRTALLDLAPLGHCALHLNAKPLFNISDATRNLHRMDQSLLESFMTRHGSGLQIMAGASAPAAEEPSTAEFVRLFDMLAAHYKYVVVDNSSRLDAVSRLIANMSGAVLIVACADVASLWSAARVQHYLAESGNRDRLRLVLSRFRKVPGFSEADAENAAGIKLLWKIPNQYFAISSAIDRGSPVMEQSNSETARSFIGLAQELTRDDVDVKRAAWSLFKTV